MSDRLDRIYKRGLSALDDFYDAKPVRTVSSMMRAGTGTKDTPAVEEAPADTDISKENTETTPVSTGTAKEHPWRKKLGKSTKKTPVKAKPSKSSSKHSKKTGR